MSAKIVKRHKKSITIFVPIELSDSIGSPIIKEGQKWMSKGKKQKNYQSSYGGIIGVRAINY
jgi:hypothetical protein